MMGGWACWGRGPWQGSGAVLLDVAASSAGDPRYAPRLPPAPLAEQRSLVSCSTATSSRPQPSSASTRR